MSDAEVSPASGAKEVSKTAGRTSLLAASRLGFLTPAAYLLRCKAKAEYQYQFDFERTKMLWLAESVVSTSLNPKINR